MSILQLSIFWTKSTQVANKTKKNAKWNIEVTSWAMLTYYLIFFAELQKLAV